MSGDWKTKARERIRRADQVVVICGQSTHSAKGVGVEVELAQAERKPYFLLNGYKNVACTKPSSAKGNDKIYKWTWDNLKALIGGAR